MKSETVAFRCPPDLIELLDKLAEWDGRTRSNMIVRLLEPAAKEAGELVGLIERMEGDR